MAGFIQRDEVYTHPKRNRIFRCLGQTPQVEIDTIRAPLAAEDRLLVCSDGLWELLRDPVMEEMLRKHAATSRASSNLVALAKEQGGVDDITAILVKLTNDAEPLKRPGISSLASSPKSLAR